MKLKPARHHLKCEGKSQGADFYGIEFITISDGEGDDESAGGIGGLPVASARRMYVNAACGLANGFA